MGGSDEDRGSRRADADAARRAERAHGLNCFALHAGFGTELRDGVGQDRVGVLRQKDLFDLAAVQCAAELFDADDRIALPQFFQHRIPSAQTAGIPTQT